MICRICYLINKAKTYFIDKKNTSSKNQPLQSIAISIYGLKNNVLYSKESLMTLSCDLKTFKTGMRQFSISSHFRVNFNCIYCHQDNRALNVETRNGYSRFSFALKKQNMWKISTKYFEDIGGRGGGELRKGT